MRLALIAIILSAVVFVGHVNAEGISYNGLIETQMPKVTHTYTNVPVAHVKDFSLTVGKAAGICELTTDDDYAKQVVNSRGQWICLLTWDSSTNGMTSTELTLEGVLNKAGNVPLGYKLHIYSNGIKMDLTASNALVKNVTEPLAPIIADYEIRYVKAGMISGLEQEVFDKQDAIAELFVNVEARPFDQHFVLDTETCDIKAGATDCSILLSKSFENEPEALGSLIYSGKVKDTKSYFQNQPIESVKIAWDFRAPEIGMIAVNSNLNGAEKEVNFEGQSYFLLKDEAIAIIKSPHTTREDNKWKPTDPNLMLNIAEGIEHSNIKEIDGKPVRFDVPGYNYQKTFNLEPLSDEINNGVIVYKYNLGGMPDGMYTSRITASDTYLNSNEYESELFRLDRFAPDIKIIRESAVLDGAISDVYFTSDITVASHGGWNDGTEIISVTMNGISLDYKGDDPAIKRLPLQEFEINSDVELIVTARDGAGNIKSIVQPLKYMPVNFSLKNFPAQLYESVEATNIRLIQSQGIKCKLASSSELAIEFSRGRYRGCTVEWSAIPDGLEAITYPTSFALVGGVQTLGEVPINYSIRFYNGNGESVIANTGSAVINVVPSDVPTLQLSSLNRLEDGSYGIRHNSNQITRYESETVPADLSLSIMADNGEVEKTFLYKQRNRKEKYQIRNAISRPRVEGKKAWDKTTYHVKAFHTRKPESSTETSFDLITFPDGSMRSNLTIDSDFTTNATEISAELQLGRFSRGNLLYDPLSMGLWESHLAIRVNGDYQPISEVMEVNENGTAKFKFDAADVFNRANAVYAISHAKSPYPEHTRTLVSRATRLLVIQSEAIEGDLSTRKAIDAVPFTASMRFNYSDTDSKVASDAINWQFSLDNNVWNDIGIRAGQQMYGVRVVEPGTTFYRVQMKNKITGEESYTPVLTLVGYDTPKIRIEGENTVYKGQKATLTIFTKEDVDIAEDGFAEWSIDNGKTWFLGKTIQSFDLIETTEILARYRLNSTSDVVEDEGYVQAKIRVTVVDPKPMRLRVSGPKQAEVGTVISLKANADHSNSRVNSPITTQWLTPSGEVINGTDISYTIKESDMVDANIGDFRFQAWVNGLEAETKSEAAVSMDVWVYEMPEIKLVLISRILIAPATIVARVDTPYFYAPGVTLEYEWILSDDIVLDRTTSSLSYLTALKPGVHNIGIRIIDNRGNMKEVFEFIDIVHADNMESGLEFKPSNDFMRAPVMLRARTTSKAGHPEDRIRNYEWSINGEVDEALTRSYANLELTEPGDYVIAVKFTSDYGQEDTQEQRVTVQPNNPPVCEPYWIDSSSSITAIANCSDEDGKIISVTYQWRDDGYISSGGTRLRFTKSLHENINLIIRATDDSGEQTVSQITWSKN